MGTATAIKQAEDVWCWKGLALVRLKTYNITWAVNNRLPTFRNNSDSLEMLSAFTTHMSVAVNAPALQNWRVACSHEKNPIRIPVRDVTPAHEIVSGTRYGLRKPDF